MINLSVKETSMNIFIDENQFNQYFIFGVKYLGLGYHSGDDDEPMPKFEIDLASFKHGINQMYEDS